MVNVRRYRLVRNVVLAATTAVLLAGMLVPFPRIDDILGQTHRNLFFHVPLWFAMMAGMGVSAWQAFRYLKTGDLVHDLRSNEAARVAFAFGGMGIVTGMVWARATWYESAGLWWNNDPKQLMAATQLMVYAAYFVLRGSVDEPVRRARLASAYNLFAAILVPLLLYVVPRQMESLHPGAEGNPAFSNLTAPAMRLVLYPAFATFIGLLWVLYTQRVRIALLERRSDPDL